MANKNLSAAKKAKNDEFYTQLSDIEKELKYYKDEFRGKVIFLNCDDPEESMFWKYFELNFDHLGIKKIISTHYDAKKPTYKLELIGDVNGDGKTDSKDIIKTTLLENGDFRSSESIEILINEADIVITNPPFSLFREYMEQLMKYKKKFLIVGNFNAVTYKEIFPLIKKNKLWIGYNPVKEFRKPDGSTQKFGNICWFTNLPVTKRDEFIDLVKTYKAKDYPKYDNYDAIEVSRVVNIPMDYAGIMGVPITFLTKYNPKQFKIKGLIRYLSKDKKRGFIAGKEKYARIIIKKRKIKNENNIKKDKG